MTSDNHSASPRSSMRNAVVAKDPGNLADKRVCLFVSYSADASIKRHVRHHIEHLKRNGFSVVLVVNADRISQQQNPPELLNGLLIRPNEGFDFGGWAEAFRVFPSLWQAERVLMINDSVYGPLGDYQRLLQFIMAKPHDLIGMTESFEIKHHYQSYFLLINRGMLQNQNFQDYWSNVWNYQTKPDVVVAYEINLLENCLSWGLRADALFANPELANWPYNPTLILWRGLLEAGFPFIKAQLLKQNPNEVDISAWASFVKDPELLSAIKDDLASANEADTAPARGPTGPVGQAPRDSA